MKDKIKLTDLSHLESLNDEMAYLKGGDDPDKGPLCWGCKCICDCSTENVGNINATNDKNAQRNGGGASWGVDIGVAVVIAVGIGILL